MSDVKQVLKSELKHLIQASFKRLGYELVRTSKRPYGWDRFFSVIRGFGFAPKHILDIGANRGQWTRTAIQYFPDAQYTLVEPRADLKAHVQDLIDSGHMIRWINAGAGDKSGVVAFTLAHRDDSGSFAVSVEQAQELGFPQAMVEVKTLNEIVALSDAAVPEMVKIDAEGFDLKVLCGATDLFGKTDIFLVEVTLVGGWDNSLIAVIEKLASLGYRPLDITDLNRSPKNGLLWLVEIAFVKCNCPLFEGITYE